MSVDTRLGNCVNPSQATAATSPREQASRRPRRTDTIFATLPDQRKLRNLHRDPRIALSIPSTTTNEWGLLEYLVVYGTARVTEGGAAEILQRLAYTYLGPDVIFPRIPDPPPGYVTRITLERLGGVGPWKPPRG